jgi:predicted HAD superfamily Cof-like phosphohydrolase
MLFTTSHYQAVRRFMLGANQACPLMPCVPSLEVRTLRARLILEEAMETIHALGFAVEGMAAVVSLKAVYEPNLVEIVDGCADVAVVATGTLIACGVADREVQQEVDSNNLAKLGPGSSIREDGKFVKAPGHKPPNIAAILDRQRQGATVADAHAVAVASQKLRKSDLA